MRRQTQEAMNRALDQQLDSEERDALFAHIDRTPADAQQWVNLQRVDRTLRTAPMVEAPAGFAQRVMAALSTGRASTQNKQHTRLSIAIALWLATAVTLPLLAGTLYVLVRVIIDSTIWTSLVNSARGFLTNLVAWLNATDPVSSGGWGWALAAIVVICAGLRLNRLLATPNKEITYQIPVRVLS